MLPGQLVCGGGERVALQVTYVTHPCVEQGQPSGMDVHLVRGKNADPEGWRPGRARGPACGLWCRNWALSAGEDAPVLGPGGVLSAQDSGPLCGLTEPPPQAAGVSRLNAPW